MYARPWEIIIAKKKKKKTISQDRVDFTRKETLSRTLEAHKLEELKHMSIELRANTSERQEINNKQV